MSHFLNPVLMQAFCDTIKSSPIFTNDEKYKGHYNLFCVVMERLDKCVNYLNQHSEPPKTEEDFITFLVFSCMIIDATKMLLKELGIENEYSSSISQNSFKFFRTVCMSSPLNISEADCPTDDKFFEYLRALAFAHPFETSRPKFLLEEEIQYSPWVISNTDCREMGEIADGVGIVIYSSNDGGGDGIKVVCFSFSILKNYILSRYLLIIEITEWAKTQIADAKEEWKKYKINRNGTSIQILEEIAASLKSRYKEYSDAETAIIYLKCSTTVHANEKAVSLYRQAIVDVLPALCDSIEAFDYEAYSNKIDSVLQARPEKVYKGLPYQLEKIFTCLDNDTPSIKTGFALAQVDAFSKGFAKDYVSIRPYEMSYDEIHLLVSTALYLEWRKQMADTPTER
ncbi:MAG: hypothetical protein LBM28_06145 [Oscillospiraceae bacterium]|jgi:hypothetical protein|nr:hypothetical protein [Oscillospiraceae bacterium]